MPEQTPRDVRWIREWYDDGAAQFRIGRDGDDLVAEWVGGGVLRASRSGGRREFTPCAGLEAPLVEKFHRGLVHAMIRHLEGKVTFHASAIKAEGLAIALAGESGAGKSTTTARLCRSSRVEMLADDTVAVEAAGPGFLVLPTEQSHWLADDAANHLGVPLTPHFKAQARAPRCADAPAPLGAIVQLRFDPASVRPTLRPLHGGAAFHALNASLFRFVIDEPSALLRDFEQLSAVSAGVPVFELERCRSLETLEASCDLIAGLASSRRAAMEE